MQGRKVKVDFEHVFLDILWKRDAGDTILDVVNAYAKGAKYEELFAESDIDLKKREELYIILLTNNYILILSNKRAKERSEIG